MSTGQTSKFFNNDSSSEDEETSSSEESEEELNNTKKKTPGFSQAWGDDSDSEEEVKRKVKTSDMKSVESIKKVNKKLKHSIQIGDWGQAEDLYKTLIKEGEKAKKTNKINPNEHVNAFLLAIKELNNKITEVFNNKAVLKKLSKARYKSFNHLKIRVPKLVEELGTEKIEALVLEEAIEEENNSDSESSESESSGSSSDSDSSSSGSDSDSSSGSDSDSSSSGSDSDSDSGSSSEWNDDSTDSDSSDDEEVKGLTGRARWVKRILTPEQIQAKKDADKQKQQEKQQEKMIKQQERALQKQIETEALKKLEAEKKAIILTPREIKEQLMSLVAQRGKKGVNKYENLNRMRKLSYMQASMGPFKIIPSLMHTISASFDIRSGIDEYMPVELWRSAMSDVRYVLKLLEENPDYRLAPMQTDALGALAAIVRNQEAKAKEKSQSSSDPSKKEGDNTDNNEEKKDAKPEEEEEEEEEIEMDGEHSIIRVVGHLGVFVNRLADEYTKCLRFTDQHAQEYVDRLSDEGNLVDLAILVSKHYLRIGDNSSAAKMCLLCIEYTYYKHDTVALALLNERALEQRYGKREFFHPACSGAAESEKELKDTNFNDFTKFHPGAASGSPTLLSSYVHVDFDPIKKMDEWCTFMYQFGDSRGQFRALICQIYHYAIHDDFYKARDLLLMSRLQDQIYTTEIDTQILFNRMMVQLGLAAFRAELIEEAHSCLTEICGNKKEKELLAQGLMWRKGERNPDQEKLEKRRQVPYHQHINLEQLEAVHLTSSMLLEIPYMALKEFDSHVQSISWQFRVLTRRYSEQVFNGPPENTKDHILAAARAMTKGDWRSAIDFVLKLSVWDLFQDGLKVREMLAKCIKKETLRTYMLSYSSNYDSMKQEFLCDLFEMERDDVHLILSKMILNRELLASWDQPTDSIVLHRREPTHLQALALQFADRLKSLVDGNERALGAGGFDDRGGRNRKDREGGHEDTKGDGSRNDKNNRRVPRGGFRQRGGYRSGRGRSFGPGGNYSKAQYNNRSGGNNRNTNSSRTDRAPI